MKHHLYSLPLLLLFSTSKVNADVGTAAAAANAAASPTGGIIKTLQSLDYRFFVAGGVCAATSHGITTPIDVVKTRMQAEPEVYDKGIPEATFQILKTDGPSALLGGLTPTIVGYGIEGALKFGIYEVAKPIMVQLLQSNQDNTALAYITASVFAGAVASIILCPMESTRIRIVTDGEYAGMGLFDGLPKLVREEGLLSTFGGIWAMLAKQVPYTIAKQVSFDIFAGLFYTLITSRDLSPADFKWFISVCSAAIASLFACIFSQPGDMILTETYKGKNQGKSVFGIVGDIYKTRGGLPGFFTGTSARIIHVGMIITSQLVIYDVVKQLLGLPATGSH